MIGALEHFAPHHQELRKRLIKIFLVIASSSVIAYVFIEPIVSFCMQPLFQAHPDIQRLVYTNLTEAFITYIKLALMVGIITSFPVILYQVWMFISPGLLQDEKKMVSRIVLWATFLFLSGAFFSYFIALPKMLTFFMSYAGSNLEALPRLGKYLTFVARMILAFALSFEIPFLMVMAARTGLVKRDHFRLKRKYFYLVIVVFAFLLSAGELTATALLSFPLFGLYEMGILAGNFFSTD